MILNCRSTQGYVRAQFWYILYWAIGAMGEMWVKEIHQWGNQSASRDHITTIPTTEARDSCWEPKSFAVLPAALVKLTRINLHNIQLSMKTSWRTKLRSAAAQQHANKLDSRRPKDCLPLSCLYVQMMGRAFIHPHFSSAITHKRDDATGTPSMRAMKYLLNLVC